MQNLHFALAATTLTALLLTGCISPQEEAAAGRIITALPQEVTGCVFVGNVDSYSRATIKSARFEIKRQTAALGGTHVVETHVFPQLMGPSFDFGFVLSGRAYICPPGKGPLIPATDATLPTPELPTPPSVNMGDDWY